MKFGAGANTKRRVIRFGTEPGEHPHIEGKIVGLIGAPFGDSWSLEMSVRDLGNFSAIGLPDEKTCRERAKIIGEGLAELAKKVSEHAAKSASR